MNKKFIRILFCLFTLTMFIVSCSKAKNPKIIDAGDEWIVSKTATFDKVTIAEGASIAAPEGFSVTMTVDGVETGIEPGTYKGDIVFTVTENIIVEYSKSNLIHNFRTAIYVEDGKYIPEKSVAVAVTKGEVTGNSAKDVKITSVGDNFNGIIATSSKSSNKKYSYSINKPEISFKGNGGNDFAGYGAAIMSDGYADVTVDKAEITTTGAIRTAVWVGGNSTMTVNDSNIEVNNGTLPEDYKFTVEMGKMMEVPWMLGLTGNCRATNLVGSATANYNNTKIKAQAWGCLSTDDTDKVKLNVKNCVIETVDSGYGAYSIGDSVDTFDGCKIDVVDMAMIIANGKAAGIFTNGTIVNSDRFGVMMHSNQSGTLVIEKECEFNTEEAVIQLKSSTPSIFV